MASVFASRLAGDWDYPDPFWLVFGLEAESNGSQIQNVVPCPSLESASILPPCWSMIQLDIERPNPKPVVFERVLDFSAR